MTLTELAAQIRSEANFSKQHGLRTARIRIPTDQAKEVARALEGQGEAHRIGFLEGAIEAITLYAIWRNGEQLVGCMENPLKEVLEPYKEELARLTAEKVKAAE